MAVERYIGNLVRNILLSSFSLNTCWQGESVLNREESVCPRLSEQGAGHDN